MSDTKCTTHHKGCACREADIAHLLERVMRRHADPSTPDYKGCDEAPCLWCEQAKRILGTANPPTPKWINPHEQLPENGQHVRIITNTGEEKAVFVIADPAKPMFLLRDARYLEWNFNYIRWWRADNS